MNAKPANIDEYLSTVAEDARAVLTALRLAIKDVAPEAVESISYGMPAFKYRGRPLAYFGAAKHHCALYGLSAKGHEEELSGFETSGAGTIRFTAARPLPEALVKALVGERRAAIDRAAQRGRGTGAQRAVR